jgi:hypothetical protein
MEHKPVSIRATHNGTRGTLDVKRARLAGCARAARENEVGICAPAIYHRSLLNMGRIFVSTIPRHPFGVVLAAGLGVVLSLFFTATHFGF